jgi:predicted nucleotidyltransferase
MQTIMNRLKQHYDEVESMGYEIIGIFLQGSQNYGLAYENSDIDSKAILLPKFNNFVLNSSPTSTTHVLENDEHVDLKDIRLMFDCFKKQNINFVEILFTKYKIMNPKYERFFRVIFEENERIARYNNYAAVNCICGMSLEKYKALEHPYPATLDKIETFGYDGKQLHHIIRLSEFMKRYIAGEKYADCLLSKNKDYLIDVKRHIHTLEEAREIAKTLSEETHNIKTEYMKNNPICVDKEVDEILNNALIDAMKHNFKSELKED